MPQRSVQHIMIAWNSDVLTTAARLCPYLDHSYVTAATEATKDLVYNNYYSNCPIWSRTERSRFLFRTSLCSVVGCSLAPLCGAYGLPTVAQGCGWMLLRFSHTDNPHDTQYPRPLCQDLHAAQRQTDPNVEIKHQTKYPQSHLQRSFPV